MEKVQPIKVPSAFDRFCEKYGLYVLLSAVIGCIFLIAYNAVDVFPFNSSANISTYDYLFQIAPFLEHIQNFLSGETSLFFSRNTMGGADLFQSLCFMMVSPFTPIFLICGKGNMFLAVNVVLPLKVMAIGCVAIYYVKKRFPTIDSTSTFLVALVYAVCGYMVSSSTYIIWLDLLIYFPFVMLGFRKLVDTGSVKMHAIASALMIYCSFSIASFSYFIVYPLYVAYVLMVVEKDKRKQVLTNVVVSLVYAILAALPILVPNLLSVANSARNTNLFSHLEIAPSEAVKHLSVKLTYIFTDSIPLVLGIFYIVKERKSPLGKFLIVAGIIILAPVVIDECCYLLNMGSYNSYALRFGFLNAFFALFTGCLFLEKLNFTSWVPDNIEIISPEEESPTNNKEMTAKEAFNSFKFVKYTKANYKNLKLIFFGICCAIFGGITIAFTFTLYFIYLNADKLTNATDFWRYSDDSFVGYFAHSEGGYNVIAWILIIALILCVIGYLLVKYKLISAKIFTLILAFFAIGQASFYTGSLVGGSTNYGDTSTTAFKEYVGALKTAKLSTDGSESFCDFPYYRVKSLADFGGNFALMHNTKDINTFSSNIAKEAFTSSDYFNYTDSVNETNGLTGGASTKVTLLGDAFMGYKYIYSTDSTQIAKYSYLNSTKLDLKPNSNTDYASYGIYENPLALPLCFYTTSATPLELKGEDYFEDMQALFEFLGGEGELFITKSCAQEENAIIEITDQQITISPQASMEGDYFIYFDFDFEVEETWNNQAKQIRYKRYYHGYSNKTSGNVREDGLTNIVTIINSKEIQALGRNQVKNKIKLKIVDASKLKQLAESAKKRLIKFTETKDGVKFKLDTKQINTDGGKEVYVYLSNNYLANSKIEVNDKEVSCLKNPTGLTMFKLENSRVNSVETSYTSPYPLIAFLTYLLASALTICLTLVRRKTKVLEISTIQDVIFCLALALALGILLFFFVYPALKMVSKYFINLEHWENLIPKTKKP